MTKQKDWSIRSFIFTIYKVFQPFPFPPFKTVKVKAAAFYLALMPWLPSRLSSSLSKFPHNYPCSCSCWRCFTNPLTAVSAWSPISFQVWSMCLSNHNSKQYATVWLKLKPLNDVKKSFGQKARHRQITKNLQTWNSRIFTFSVVYKRFMSLFSRNFTFSRVFIFFLKFKKKKNLKIKLKFINFMNLRMKSSWYYTKFMKFHENSRNSWNSWNFMNFLKFMKFLWISWSFMNFLKFHEISWISWILLKFHEFREFSCNFMNFVNFRAISWISWIFRKVHEFS